MARSPSPTGSSYSRRSRHDDRDRRRDDRRDHDRDRDRHRDHDRDRERRHERQRRRSRSRSPGRYDRRYRDDSRDRQYSRRDRSRDRDSRRPRDMRDDRRRSPDRNRRDASRDRDRKRRDPSTERKRDGRRAVSRDRKAEQVAEAAPSATPAQSAQDKMAEKLARLEEWKKKRLAAVFDAKSDAATPTSTRSLLDDMDRTAASSASPASPASPSSPRPYAGKFDPKAIVKKATANSAAANRLGLDVAIPDAAASLPSVTADSTKNAKASAGKSAGFTKATSDKGAVSLKSSGNLSGFGLGARSTDAQKPSAGLDFGDEENKKRKLEKLPNARLENDDSLLANGAHQDDADEEEDDDVDMQDGTEEEAAAAARAAAEKRDERLHAQNIAYQEGDVTMQDNETPQVDQPEDRQSEEEVDPLDAFMADLGSSAAHGVRKPTGRGKKAPEPVAMFGDEDDGMDAVEDENTDDIMAMAANKRKKKDIPNVDHAKVTYEPFRRDFYHEPSELADMTEEDLADLRLELDGIKVRGVDVPKPVISWAQCGLGVQTLDVVAKLNYEKPSAIQSQAIPSIMSGRDVIGVAKTGSGKTVAFLLPMFRHIKDQRPLDNLEGPVALIMTPTRELATQIHRDCKPFLKALNLRAVCAYGGAPIKDQIAELKRGAEVVVCTPGRMIDLLAANAGRVTNLKRVTYCVLDEADRMFDMGFEPQVMKILGNIRPDRQTVLFSATFPRQMEALARKTLNKPVEIIVGGRSVVAPEISQIIEVRPEESKFVRLLELLGELYEDDVASADYRALIFVERQESADGLLRDLMRKGYPCMSIHGGKDQIDRDSTIHDFKAGVVPIMIATSVAARGLDVKQLKLVVNYDTPNHLEDYVHRAGRTGRAGNTGTAVTFITPDQDRYSVDLVKALTQSGQQIPEPLQKLVDAFRDKVKAGKEKAAGSGFGGRGLERLDQDRDAARNAQRKAYKTGDEPDEDDKEENAKASKNDDLIAKAASSVQAAGTGPSQASKAVAGIPAGIDLDGKITVHKTEVPSTAAGSGGADGKGGASSGDPMDRVRAVVGRLNSKVGGGNVSSSAPLDNKGPDAGAYHATLEINDFPQKARWAVTNRTNVAKILEATGTAITTKGNFYPPGKDPPPGDLPPLYILVEGDTEIAVTNAMRELMRLLKEGAIAAAEGEARAPTGRYNVL